MKSSNACHWLVFNVLVGNSDAHLKNLSFMVSHEGVQLAPFYDLLSVASNGTPSFDKKGWPTQSQLAWPILGVRHFADINRRLMLEAGAALNLAKGTAERLLENLRSRIVQTAETLYVETESENARICNDRPYLSVTMAGESRCLRTIQHIIIKEMVKQVA